MADMAFLAGYPRYALLDWVFIASDTDLPSVRSQAIISTKDDFSSITLPGTYVNRNLPIITDQIVPKIIVCNFSPFCLAGGMFKLARLQSKILV